MATYVVTSSSSRSSWSSTWTTCWNHGSSTSSSTTSCYGGTTYESTVDGQPHRITGLSRKSTNLGILSLLWTRTSRTRLRSTMQASPRMLQHYEAPATNVGYYLIQLSATHGIWPWLSTSRISRNYVVTFSNANSSTSTSATTKSTGYLLQPTGTQSRHTTVTFTSTSIVYKFPTQAKPILPAPAKTVPPNQHTCGYQPTGSKSSRCTRSTSASRCTRSTSSSSSSTSSRFPWSSKCPRPSSLSCFSSCPRPTVYPSSSSCSRSHSQCSYPARNTSGTDEWKPTHEPGPT